ncbi:hypothetical protein A2U01_0109107, partial [Trifolium medium]|nr:hypothetical protein [Trifolium medium]
MTKPPPLKNPIELTDPPTPLPTGGKKKHE